MPRKKSPATDETAARIRLADVERKRDVRGRGSDIGEIPKVVDPERRKKAEADFGFFAETYFPHSCGLWPPSKYHVRSNTRMQAVAESGGRDVEALPRGSGKTTRSEVFGLWCVLTGKRQFVALFGSESGKAQLSMDSIKMELSSNDILHDDFPEVTHAVRSLEGKPQRCAGQMHDGKLTRIEWTAEMVVLPMIAGSKASGAIICCHGLMASSRGIRYKRADGTMARPDLVILDDIQTDESAASPVQIAKRMNVIKKNILKMGGHGKDLAVVCNATVIQKDDVIDRLLADPAWQGVRVKMVEAWSDRHDDMWMTEYKRLRQTYDKAIDGDIKRARAEATEYYRANQAAMDAGCVVYWEHCYDHANELGAIQHAYNALIDDGPEVFASEYQQEPLADESRAEGLRPADLRGQVVNVPRMVVPDGLDTLTAFVDVQEKALYWMVCGFGPQLRGHILGYGTYPDQKRAYYQLREIENTLVRAAGGTSLPDAMHKGLEAVAAAVLDHEFQSETSDTVHRVGLMMVDANWSLTADVTRDFARRSKYGTRLIPSHGRYVGASGRTMSDGKAERGERVGANWRTSTIKRQRHVLFDTNHWKTMTAARLKLGPADPLSLTIHAGSHDMLLDQLASEYPTRVENKSTNRVVDEWRLVPGRDNHFLDCLVGSMVAASYLGVSAVGAESSPRQSRKVISREEMAARREALMASMNR